MGCKYSIKSGNPKNIYLSKAESQNGAAAGGMAFIRTISINTDRQHPFPFNIPAIRYARDINLSERVTIFVGDNGTGKSTLLESIACRLNVPLIGGFMGESKSFAAAKVLKPYVEIGWRRETTKGFFFRAEDFSHFVDSVERERMKLEMELGDLKGKVDDAIIEQMSESMNRSLRETRRQYGSDLQAFSHGEAYLTILHARIADKGIYLLDEPEAALSPLKQLSLIAFILEVLKKGNAQFIIATHSPILMGIPDATIYQIVDEGMEQVKYKETDHYQITRRFLNEPESYLRHLR
jgi:predicted ATPase